MTGSFDLAGREQLFTHVVTIGNAFDGMRIFGPFTSSEDGLEWAEQNAQGDDYLVVALEVER